MSKYTLYTQIYSIGSKIFLIFSFNPDEKNFWFEKNNKLYFESEIVEFESKYIKCKEIVKHNINIFIAKNK